MSITPKCNRTWNKQEKQIIRLLYRKGIISPEDIKGYYWESFKISGKRYRLKGKYSGRKFDGYLDEVYYCTFDYWGEMYEHPVVDGIIDKLTWAGVTLDLNQVDVDDVCKVLASSSFKYQGRRWFIRYLKALPTVRCDSKINEILMIRTH